jgi:hypothetical protein
MISVAKTFKLEIEFILDQEEESAVVSGAREIYARQGGATTVDEGRPREIPAKEFIPDATSALIELVLRNPLLQQSGVEARRVSCNDPDFVPEEELDEFAPCARQASDSEDSSSGGLDVFETGVYLYRWPNGEFSIVQAENRRDAILQLDEWGAVHSSWIVPLETFMVDFGLSPDGQIELRTFGEETEYFLREYCYPELERVFRDELTPDEDGEYSNGDREKIRAAVALERQRLWESEPPPEAAETEAGKALQQQLRSAGPVADHYIKLRAKRLLRSKLGEDGKPN